MSEIVGESVDKVVNLEMWDDNYPIRGRGHLFAEATRAKQGAPMTYLAARGLMDNVKKDDYVLLLSGAGIWPWLPYGEPDLAGGSGSLARALSFGLGARPAYVGYEKELGPVVAAGVAAGISVSDREAMEVYGKRSTALSIPFPLGEEGARERALEILDDLDPAAVVSVGHSAPNPAGVKHASLGQAVSGDVRPHTYHIVEEAKRRGIFTIGIGHVGAEIGYAVIMEEVNDTYQQFFGGETCRCGCGGGMASAMETDVLITAATTNWGAYGISACLAHMTEDPFVLHDADTERRILEAMVAAGAAGYRGSTLPWPGSTSPTAHYAVVTLLQEIVAHALRRLPPYDIPVVEGVTKATTRGFGG